MDDAERRKMQALLLSYVGLLAERHAVGPDENFEYQLWDDLDGNPPPLRFLSNEEAAELTFLAMRTDSWVTYDFETGMFKLIAMDEWFELLRKRGH
jgi:hypothetical protein